MSEDDDSVFLWLIFIRQKAPAQKRPNAEDLQVICRNFVNAQPFRTDFAREVQVDPANDRNAFHHGRLLFPIGELGAGDRVLLPSLPRGVFPKLHQLAGLIVRQCLEQHAIHDAEDGRACADSQRQCEHGNCRETVILPQHPQTKTNVLQRCFAKTRAARLATFLANALHVAEALPRLPRRCLRRHAGGDVLRRALLEVKAQFLVNLPFHLAPLPQPADSRPDCSQCFHVLRITSHDCWLRSSTPRRKDAKTPARKTPCGFAGLLGGIVAF